MSKITALNIANHAKLKLKESNDFRRFKDQHLIPIVMQDFASLAAEFPIVFVKSTETDQLVPVAMMGIKNGVNLYCQEEAWTTHTKPLSFSAYPLTFYKTPEADNDYIICFDEESSLISETEGQPLFDDNAEQSEYLKTRTSALLKIIEYTKQTTAFSKYLDDNNLLINQQLNLTLANTKESIKVDGIYIVDEKKLNELPTDKFDDIRKKGLLGLIYSHLVSIKQMSRLANKQSMFDAH